MLNVYNILIFLTNFAPVWALLIERMDLQGKNWFLVSEIVAIGCSLAVLVGFQHWRWYYFANIVWCLYFVEIAVMLYLFDKRFGHKYFSKSLACAILVVFVLSEAHEWVGFIFADYLNLFVDPYTLLAGKVPIYQRILSNLYIIIAFSLLCKMAGVKASKKTIMYFMLSLLIPVFFLYIPSLNPLHIVKRAFLFACWAAIYYVYSDATISSGVGGKNVLPKL